MRDGLSGPSGGQATVGHCRLLHRLLVPAAAAAIGIVTAAGLAIRFVAAGRPVLADQAWHDLMADFPSPGADRIARTLNSIGGTPAMTAVVTVASLVMLARRERRAAAFLVTSLVASSAASNLLKVIVGRARPIDAVIEDRRPAFPSGHATSAGALGVALGLLVRRPWAWALVPVWAVSMAWSRTYLLLHWLSDTVAGLLLGASISVLADRLMPRRRWRRARPRRSGR